MLNVNDREERMTLLDLRNEFDKVLNVFSKNYLFCKCLSKLHQTH